MSDDAEVVAILENQPLWEENTMHEQTAEAPRWVGFILLAFGTLIFVFGRRMMGAWTQAQTKLREQMSARLPYLRHCTDTPTAWHAKVLMVFVYIFAGVSLFAGTMTLFRP